MKKFLSIILGFAMIITSLMCTAVIAEEDGTLAATDSFGVSFGSISDTQLAEYKDVGVVDDSGLTTGYVSTYIDHNGIVMTNSRPGATSNYGEAIRINAEKVIKEYDPDTRSMLTQSGLKGKLNIRFTFQHYDTGGQYRIAFTGIKDDGTIVNTDHNSGSSNVQMQAYGYTGPGAIMCSVADIGTSTGAYNITLDTTTGDFSVYMTKDGVPVGTTCTANWGECGEDVAFYGVQINPTSCNNNGPRTMVIKSLEIEKIDSISEEDIKAVADAADSINTSDIAADLSVVSPGEIMLPELVDSDVTLIYSSSDASIIEVEDIYATVKPNTNSYESGEAWLNARFVKGSVSLTKKFKIGVLSSLLYQNSFKNENEFNALKDNGVVYTQNGNWNSVTAFWFNGYGMVHQYEITKPSYTFGNAFTDFYFKDYNQVYTDSTKAESWTDGYIGKMDLSFDVYCFDPHTFQIYLLMKDPDGNVVLQAANAEPCLKSSSGGAWTFNGTTVSGSKDFRANFTIDTYTGEVVCTANGTAAGATLPHYGEGYKLYGIRTFAYGGTASGRLISINNIKLSRNEADADDDAVRDASRTLTKEVLGVDSGLLTGDVTLPETLKGAEITWTSETSDTIGADGKVTLPSQEGTSADAILVATITKGDYTMYKRFRLSVVNPGVRVLNPTPDLSAGNVTYTINNFTGENVKGSAYLASYAGNKMIALNIIPIDVKAGTAQEITQNLNLTSDSELIKLMILTDKLRPYLGATSYNLK